MDALTFLGGAVAGCVLTLAAAYTWPWRPGSARRGETASVGDTSAKLLAEVSAARRELVDLRNAIDLGADRVAGGLEGIRRDLASRREPSSHEVTPGTESARSASPVGSRPGQSPRQAEPGTTRAGTESSSDAPRADPRRDRTSEARPLPAQAAGSPAEEAVAVWQRMLSQHGTMSARAAKESVSALGLRLEVHGPADIGLPADAPLLVLWDGVVNAWVLPDFSRTFASVEPWFDIPAEAARTDNVSRLVRPARYLREERSLERGRVG